MLSALAHFPLFVWLCSVHTITASGLFFLVLVVLRCCLSTQGRGTVVGEELINDPRVELVSFTGSTKVIQHPLHLSSGALSHGVTVMIASDLNRAYAVFRLHS